MFASDLYITRHGTLVCLCVWSRTWTGGAAASCHSALRRLGDQQGEQAERGRGQLSGHRAAAVWDQAPRPALRQVAELHHQASRGPLACHRPRCVMHIVAQMHVMGELCICACCMHDCDCKFDVLLGAGVTI